MSKVGFVTMADSSGGEKVPSVGIGMLGYGFMGKAHSNAYKTLAYMTWPPPLMPELVAIAGRNPDGVAAAAVRYGFDEHLTDWRKLISDPRVQVFDNSSTNDFHSEPSIAAAEAGKHVICEKPLGRSADEAYETWQRVAAAGVKHMCAFNYRFVPAIRLAREIIEAGELGEIYHFRGSYLQEWIVDADFPMVWRLDKSVAGSGSLGDLGAHVIDLARYLVGEIDAVSATTRTFIKDRGGAPVDVDDSVEALVDFEGGAVGIIEASRFCPGRKNQPDVRDQRLQGLAGVRHGAPERAAGALRRLHARPLRPGVPQRARVRVRPPVLAALVAAGAHDRLGAHVRARAAPLPDRDPRGRRRGAARGDVRGRLPGRGDLRRDAAVGGRRVQGARELPLGPAHVRDAIRSFIQRIVSDLDPCTSFRLNNAVFFNEPDSIAVLDSAFRSTVFVGRQSKYPSR